ANNNPALEVQTNGTSDGGAFVINNANNGQPAVFGYTNGKGWAGNFAVANATSPAVALHVETNGLGSVGDFRSTNKGDANNAFSVTASGTKSAGGFEMLHPSNTQAAILGLNDGNGPAISGVARGTGYAGVFTGTTRGVSIVTNSGSGLSVVGGTKNAIVSTPGGARALYTEESTEVWF